MASLNTDIFTELATHPAVLVCKLDIAKAFDTLPPRLILEELQRCNVGTGACRLLAHYLTGRSFRVKLRELLTTARSTHRGVPQGSALGPLLYIVATRGIATMGLKGRLHVYADDIVLTYGCRHGTEDRARADLALDLEALDCWYRGQGMALQHRKTQFFAVAPPKLFKCLASQPILHNGVTSTIQRELVILGVTFDAYFTFTAQVKSLSRKLANYATPFRRLARHLSLKEKRRLIVMCLYTILDYGAGNWAPIQAKDRRTIYRKVNYLIRVLLHLHPRTRMTPIYARLGLRKPDDHMAMRIAEATAIRVRKGDFPLTRDAATNGRSDRHYLCSLPNVRKPCARRTPNFRDASWWNRLPVGLREANATCTTCGVVCHHFRRRLKNLSLGNHYADFLRNV